jgi:hypothetical protein
MWCGLNLAVPYNRVVSIHWDLRMYLFQIRVDYYSLYPLLKSE